MAAASSGTLEDIFDLLKLANTLEESGTQRIEAATKYYEAVYLIRTHVQHLPVTPQYANTRRLLTEKATHYEGIAKELVNDDSSDASRNKLKYNNMSPRSPVSLQTSEQAFFPAATPTVPVVSSQALTLATQANAKLLIAIDIDEKQQRQSTTSDKKEAIIQAYMQAAELYLQAIQIHAKAIGNQVNLVTWKRRLEQTLDRIEQLKHSNTTITKSAEIPAPLPSIPASSSKLSSEEVQVLKQSSLMASGLFLPWSDEEANQFSRESVSTLSSQQKLNLYKDPQGHLRLNARQQKHFYKWARPCEIIHLRQQQLRMHASQQSISIRVIQNMTPFSITQQYVTDCSFIASLCICAALERRFGTQIVSSMLHPQRQSSVAGASRIYPIVSPTGKYMVKLWFNGVPRCVVIDDYLPVDKYGNLLCSVSTFSAITNQQQPRSLELWVPLIEKAYMKLCGGYDFPGSNSGVDLFSLTGWIPERVLFASDASNVRDYETAPERVWDRIFGASAFGDCLVTVSTTASKGTADGREEMVLDNGIVTQHAYAVLNVVQTTNGTRLLLLKNPWGQQEWKGKYSSSDTDSWTPSLCAEVGYKPSKGGKCKEDGVFWISWEDLLTHFHNFHLSWNPRLFNHRVVRHGRWPRNVAPDDDSFNVGENPQYIVAFSEAAARRQPTVWILASRHVDKQEQEGIEVNDYLTVHVHRNTEQKNRIWYAGKGGDCILTGAYTNNPHVLVRYDLQGQEDQFLSLILSQYKKSNDLNYTLSCFCTEPFILTRPPKDLPLCIELFSQWTDEKAGGALGTKYAYNNPQFALATPTGGSMIQITVTTIRTSAICFILVPVAAYGQAVTASNVVKPIIDTGKYRHGFVASERQLLPHGTYTLLVTNYDRGKIASFELKISSSAKIKVMEIR
ncbi:hypothetical protein MPSEU_000983800 [Mayamaea pseudoterrestris]|nr:hypothetical protein MPSEU_000983800 [Mayamaea pseudoterrestris]